MTRSRGDELLLEHAARVRAEAQSGISLRGVYYRLVEDEVLLNRDDEWQRLVRVVDGSHLAALFRWEPLAPGASNREPDMS